jgi:hypothetical protein
VPGADSGFGVHDDVVFKPRIDVNLSIDVESDPISGYVQAGADPAPQPFTGWVELSGAIESVRERTPDSAEALGADPGMGTRSGPEARGRRR